MLYKRGKHGEKSIWECDICQKHFPITNARATETTKRDGLKMCSPECHKIYNQKYGSKKVTDWVKNVGHSMFRGGIGITTDGYLWILVKNQGYWNNQVKLHRYLMEIKLGRKLKPTEIVHHIDGDKFNNSIDNLEILDRAKHNKIHRHFNKENRDDIWTDEEINDLKLNYNEFIKKHNRTKAAYLQKRHRLKFLALAHLQRGGA